MRTESILKKAAAGIATATLALALSACASHPATTGQTSGEIRTEASAQQNTSSDQVVGTAPAPANAQNVSGTSAPAIISGPAKVDDSGRAYTSSSVGSAGNGSSTGLNTNVNLIPAKSSSNVTVTQSASTTETTVAETTPVEVPAPVVAAPTVTEPAPMSSSTVEEPAQTTTNDTTTTTETATKHHHRMRKD